MTNINPLITALLILLYCQPILIIGFSVGGLFISPQTSYNVGAYLLSWSTILCFTFLILERWEKLELLALFVAIISLLFFTVSCGFLINSVLFDLLILFNII